MKLVFTCKTCNSPREVEVWELSYFVTSYSIKGTEMFELQCRARCPLCGMVKTIRKKLKALED